MGRTAMIDKKQLVATALVAMTTVSAAAAVAADKGRTSPDAEQRSVTLL